MPATNTPATPSPDEAAVTGIGDDRVLPDGPAELTIEQALAAAVSLQRQKRLEQAEALFNAVLEAEPNSPDALHFLGVLRAQQGRAEEAVDLIRRAIDIAPDYGDAHNNLGNILRSLERFPEALDAFDRAVELRPDLAEAHLNRAGMLRRCRRLPEAAASYRRAIALNPQLSQAHMHLGNALYMMGLVKEAGDAFANWHQIEPDNPVAGHMAAACGATRAPDRASDTFVRHTFDEFARSFDEKMGTLNYCAPDLVAAALAARLQPERSLHVLDAGCGTGLCGPHLAPYARQLDGVDLSGQMVERARDRGVYHDLAVAELTAFLQTTPHRYDLIVSADTLCYFGALEDVLRAAARSLRPGGLLVFTVESLDGEAAADTGFALQPHGRYAHRKDYLRRCVEQAGMTIVDLARDTLRLEMGQPVRGFVVTASRGDQQAPANSSSTNTPGGA